jgi:hypothetical protein
LFNKALEKFVTDKEMETTGHTLKKISAETGVCRRYGHCSENQTENDKVFITFKIAAERIDLKINQRQIRYRSVQNMKDIKSVISESWFA